MAKPQAVEYTVTPQGDIVGADKCLVEMCELVSNTAPPPYNLRAFDERMLTWEPLRKLIQARRSKLVVTIDQLCDYFGMDRDLMYDTLWRAQGRYDNIKIYVIDEIDVGKVNPCFDPSVTITLGRITLVTFLIDYDEANELAEMSERKRRYNGQEETASPKRRRTGAYA